MIDKQKWPLQVLKDLKELEEMIESSEIQLDLVSDSESTFVIKPRSKELSDFYFRINGIDKPDPQTIKINIKVYPWSANLDTIEISVQGTLKRYIAQWLSIIKQYEVLQFGVFSKSKQDPLQPEDDIYTAPNDVLACCLKSLSVSDFQGVKDAEIKNLPVDTQWVFLIGENGFGKTTLLQAILLGLRGTKDGNIEFHQDRKTSIEVEYKNNGKNVINDCWSNTNPLINLAAYGPARLNLKANASINDEERISLVSYSLFNADGALLNINDELYKWALKKDKRFDLVKKAFCTLIPNLADVRYNKEIDQIEYLEEDLANDPKNYEALPFLKLAAGFRSIIGMAGDIIIRLSNHQPKVNKLSNLQGIVLIDELDLHWHPKLQKQIPMLFSKVFPKVQFIVSTHSPIPLLGAPANSVILKITRTQTEGIQVERVIIDLENLTPNLLLSSGIFDMDDIFSVQNQDITQVRTEDTHAKMIENDEIEHYLSAFEESNRQFPNELFTPKAN